MGNFWRAFPEFVADIDKVYFAGGEPLLQGEHYEILAALEAHQRYDTWINYNTNLSVLDYRGVDVTQLWKKFPRVYVSASLDASGARGELMRHGQSWARVLENRERIRRECPHVTFRTACTAGALNAWHLPDFHRELIRTDFISPEEFDINFASGVLDAQVLPHHFKQRVSARVLDHVAWLRSLGEGAVAERFEAFERHLWQRDLSHQLPTVFDHCEVLDERRGERTVAVFPELASVIRRSPPLARLARKMRARQHSAA